MTSAPKARVAEVFTSGVIKGMTMRADHAALGGVIGHGLGMVAGAGSDDATTLLLVAQQQDAVERATLLEGAGALQIIQLEKDMLAGHVGERGGKLAGGTVDKIPDPMFCLLYFNEGDVHSLD